MVEDAYVNHVPVMIGRYGREALRRFYAEDFISLMPSDTSIKLISRTLGQDQLVDEMIFSFTHTEEMPWMLPGVPPTHRHVDIPLARMGRHGWELTPRRTAQSMGRCAKLRRFERHPPRLTSRQGHQGTQNFDDPKWPVTFGFDSAQGSF